MHEPVPLNNNLHRSPCEPESFPYDSKVGISNMEGFSFPFPENRAFWFLQRAGNTGRTGRSIDMVILLITIEVVLNPLGRRMRVRIPGIGVGLGRNRKAGFGFICSKSIQSGKLPAHPCIVSGSGKIF